MLQSKITIKGQTTVPSGVRKALGVGPGDSIGYIIEGDRAVLVKATAEGEDAALDAFLDLLGEDIRRTPQRLRGISPGLVERVRSLTAGTPVNPDEPIHGPVSL
jgi:antitoxin PrlF